MRNCPHCGEQIEFTPEEQLERMIEFHKEIINDPEKCRKFLISTGVYNEDGSLKEEYK